MTSLVPYPSGLRELDLFAIWQNAPQLEARLDPFAFSQRMAAYRQLINASNQSGLFGSDNAANPLWGLMFQHQWQYRSGRLGPNTATSDRIDPNAPWGYGNYTLCVLPWLGAEAAGLVPSLTIMPPPTSSVFNYVSGGGRGEATHVPHEFAEPLQDWRAFFELVRNFKNDADQEPLRMAMWKAHKSSLDVIAKRVATLKTTNISSVELTFLQGWCRMVDYLWAAAWPTNFTFMINNGLDVLPERLLTDADADLLLADMPNKVRKNVRNVVGLGRLSGWRHQLHLWLWRRAMRTRSARNEVTAMLDAVFSPKPTNKAERQRLLRYMIGI